MTKFPANYNAIARNLVAWHNVCWILCYYWSFAEIQWACVPAQLGTGKSCVNIRSYYVSIALGITIVLFKHNGYIKPLHMYVFLSIPIGSTRRIQIIAVTGYITSRGTAPQPGWARLICLQAMHIQQPYIHNTHAYRYLRLSLRRDIPYYTSYYTFKIMMLQWH